MEAKENSTKVSKSLINSETQEDVELRLNAKAMEWQNDLSNLLGVDLDTYLFARENLNQIAQG